MEIIIGTYEEFLVGYTLKKSEDGDYSLQQSFTNHAHCGSIRSVAASSKYLASGSVDEGIHLINMKHRIDTGTLISHTGTITALQFLRSSYLFSASEDGNICIWNTKNWKCEKILRGHKEGITSLHLHSSGKLLISVSKDKTLRTWNLVKGRCAYIINLKQVAYRVMWSTTCIYFAVVFDNHVDIYDISTGGIFHSIDRTDFEKRITNIIFIDDNTIIVCGDCNELMIYDIGNKCVVNRFEAHSNRIKDMSWVNLNDIDSELVDQTELDENSRWLITVSSDGFIKIWAFDFANLKNNPTLIAKVNSTCRPTSLAFFTSNQNSKKNLDNFSIPELKISKEELLLCKTKIKEKKAKRKNMEDIQENAISAPQTDDISKTDNKLVVPTKKLLKPKNKKLKVSESEVVPKTELSKVPKLAINEDDDDDDDVDAIRAMKPTSNALKQMTKFKKNKKRNMTTFKMRLAKKRSEKEAKKSATAAGTANGSSSMGGFKVVNMGKKKNFDRVKATTAAASNKSGNKRKNLANKTNSNSKSFKSRSPNNNKSNAFKSRPTNNKKFR